MPDSQDQDEQYVVLDLVDDSVVAGPHPPSPEPPTNWVAVGGRGFLASSSIVAWTRRRAGGSNFRSWRAAAGTVSGPTLAHAGGNDWQAGAILRTRRNDRRLPLGDSHVRNGDRFRVVSAAPNDGLVVEDLAGRGRTVLPASYLEQYATYGWASTIDGAQGATADIGILLARPGLDREHLYVAMTRGRHTNHVHVTGATDDHAEHRPTIRSESADPTLDEASKTLQAAAARMGASHSAHSLLDQARNFKRQRPDRYRSPTRRPAAARRQADLRPIPPQRAYAYPPAAGQSASSMSR